MQQVSADVVEDTWREMALTEPDEVQALVDDFHKEQPAVLIFLMAAGESSLEMDDRETLLYLGTVLWQMMKRGGMHLPVVEPEAITDALERNYQLVSDAMSDEGSDDEIGPMSKFFLNHPQPEVLRFIVEAVLDPYDEEEEKLGEESASQILVYLKSVLDAFSLTWGSQQ